MYICREIKKITMKRIILGLTVLVTSFINAQIKFEKDERIEQGGCFIESEIGNADGRISSQLNELKRKFETAINSD